jgi:hypothetical protein
MAASYPASAKSFTTHVNLSESIDASHVNGIQDEIYAIETTLGTSPALATNGSGTFDGTARTWPSVSARIANLENGVVGDSHTQYIKKSADTANIITPSAIGNKGLVVKAAAGQTANLMEWQSSAGTAVTYIDNTGTLKGVSVTGNITIGSTTIAVNGSASTIAGLTLTAPVLNNPTLTNTTLYLATVNAPNTTYTFTAADGYGIVLTTNTNAVAVTIPSGLLAIGAQLNLVQYGAGGQVTISGGSGVTVYSTGAAPSAPKTRVQYSVITLVQVNTNVWLATGDLV